jgi:hypothetical protein
MECYKEYPRSIGLLTGLSSVVYLMTAEALLLDLSFQMAGGFALIYAFVHYVHYPRSACVNCYYYGRYCISFKGRLARLLRYRRGSEAGFHAGMKRAMRGVYVLWVYPFVMLVIAQVKGRPLQVQDLLLAAVLIALMVMRQLMRRSLGCRTCMMRDKCPNVGPDPRRPVEVINGAAVSPKS